MNAGMDNASILIVDDDPDHRFLLAAAIQEGYPSARVTLAADGIGAVCALESGRVDAVLCDDSLKGTTGSEIQRAIERLGQDVPFFLIAKKTILDDPADLVQRLGHVIGNQRTEVDRNRAERMLGSFIDNNPSAIEVVARLLDGTDAAILFADPELGVRFANRHVRDFFGIEPDEIIGAQVLPAAERLAGATSHPDAFLERIRRESTGPSKESDHEIELVSPKHRHLRRRSRPVQDAAGRMLGQMDVYTDETEAVEKRRLLEEQNRELDAFAARLAHDLKTPLLSLKGFLDLLHRQYSSSWDERARLFLDKVRASASLIGEMVDGLRELAHASEGAACETHVEPLPALRLAADALAGSAAEKGVEVILPSSFAPVDCERARLFQIFQNLLSNAIRYSDPEKSHRWVKVETRECGLELAISVSDNGVGMDSDELPEMFRPFRRGRRSTGKPGMGLGLAIVSRIVQVCGGRLEASSRAGEGSNFTVFLPRSKVNPPGSPKGSD